MPSRRKKFLCICGYGHSRSVAMCRVLHKYGCEAIAAGSATAGDGINVLAEWADHIIVMQPCYADPVPADQKHKIEVFDVGPDVWSNPYNTELLNTCEGMLQQWLDNPSSSLQLVWKDTV